MTTLPPQRITEYNAILGCLKEYSLFDKLHSEIQLWAAKTIERSLFNAVIDKAKEKGIPTYWTEDDFISQYASLGYTLKINLDVNSSVNRDKLCPDYSASRVY